MAFAVARRGCVGGARHVTRTMRVTWCASRDAHVPAASAAHALTCSCPLHALAARTDPTAPALSSPLLPTPSSTRQLSAPCPAMKSSKLSPHPTLTVPPSLPRWPGECARRVQLRKKRRATEEGEGGCRERARESQQGREGGREGGRELELVAGHVVLSGHVVLAAALLARVQPASASRCL